MRAAASELRARDPEPSLPAPPIRLRFLLFLGLAYGAFLVIKPRVVAAWQLHSRASALADYGACMVGPTGPGLLRDRRHEEFMKLVRRRLVASPADAVPFERCAPLATALSGSSEHEPAHHARAGSFSEYGGVPAPSQTLSELQVSSTSLAELARTAWPLARGYTALVKTSFGRREAAHPAPPPEPVAGRGLPPGQALFRAASVNGNTVVVAQGTGAHREAFESRDGGVTFRRVSASVAGELAERCAPPVHGRSFGLGASASGATTVLSLEPPNDPLAAELARASEEVRGIACDERVLVAAVRGEGTRTTLLRQCEFGKGCTALESPLFVGPGQGSDHPLELARAGGATIVAVKMGNIVRVASTRDGKTWTPATVAYDGGEHPLESARMPSRLLTVGRRVFLFGSSPRPGQSYGLLYSDDSGASFRGR